MSLWVYSDISKEDAIRKAGLAWEASVRRAAKTDANHEAIVKALRQCGAFVQSLAPVGNGCPDALVGYAGKTAVIEIKDGSKPPSQRKLTPDQLQWHANWCGGTLAVVDGVEAALRVLAVMRNG